MGKSDCFTSVIRTQTTLVFCAIAVPVLTQLRCVALPHAVSNRLLSAILRLQSETVECQFSRMCPPDAAIWAKALIEAR